MEDIKRWLGVEMSKEDWQLFRVALIKSEIDYEPSECYDKVHIEMHTTKAEAKRLLKEVFDL